MPDLHAKKETYYEKNKAHILARCKEAYSRNPEMFLRRVRKYQSANPKRRKAKHRLFESKLRESLGDSYIKLLLSKGTNLPMNAWPDSLVQLKRAELQLKRYLKTYGKTKEHH